VFRRYGADGTIQGDVLTVEGDAQDGEALIRQVMKDGKRIGKLPPLDDIRKRCAEQLANLPAHLRRLDSEPRYEAEVSEALKALAAAVDRETR
jgi:nicotinate phosphoribosyltransferase